MAEGREKLQRSLELALDAGLERHAAVAYCNLVACSHDIRDYETAVAQLEAGRAFCDEHDLLAWDIYLGGWEAHIALDHGRWARGGGARRARTSSARAARCRTAGSARCSSWDVLHARRGDADPWPALDEALAIAVAANELDTLGPVAIARAEARWLAGEADLVAEETDDALARAERSDHRWLIGELAIWRHRAGLPHAGGERLPRALPGGAHGRRSRGRGVLELRADAATTPRSRWPPATRRTICARACASCRASAHDPAAAIVARRLRERGARGVQLGPRAATRANPAGLTARQLDVLALLTRGDRNADIAAKLFLSEKTVDHHVSAILRKLGVRTPRPGGRRGRPARHRRK